MNYIKKILALLMLSSSLSLIAQDMVVYNTTAGNLSSVIPADELKELREVKLTGTVNAADFFFIRDNIKEAKTIDMSEVQIEACEVSGVSYAANEIPANAFYEPYASTGLSRLSTFYFPLSVESIGENALYQSIILRTTNLAELPVLRIIKAGAMSRCTRLREVELPASLEEIGATAFAHNSQLSDVTIAPESQLRLLGKNAFNGCIKLSSLDFSATQLEEVGEQAFNACSILNSVLLPASVKYIGEAAFMYTSVNQIDWSHLVGMRVVEGSMFYGVGTLNSVILPHSVEQIKASAFALCSGLSTISLPYHLVAIGDWAFANCTSLRTIVCPTPIVPQVGYLAFQGVNTSAVEVQVLESVLPLYENDADWGYFQLKGDAFTGISVGEHQDLQVCRRYGNVEIVSPIAIKSVAIYAYNGTMLRQERIDNMQAIIELSATEHCIVSIAFVDGNIRVVKL